MLLSRMFAAVTVLAVSTAQAEIIYVDVNCPGPGNGSEAEPYCSIQTAIDAAVNTDEVVVAAGTYFETIDFLGKAITVRSADGPLATTIDGTGFPNSVVTFLGGEPPSALLAGFQITGGSNDSGGGVIIDNSSAPTLAFCAIVGNTAENGGAVFIVCNPCAPLFYNCVFVDNTATGCAGGIMNDSILTLICCTFFSNTGTDGFCGALHNGSASDTEISYTSFCNNQPLNISGPWTDAGGNNLNGCGTECPPLVDCNGNWLDDTVEVAHGVTPDRDGDGFPDHCQPCFAADVDIDMNVGLGDFLLVLAHWGPCPPKCIGDVDGDNTVGINDLLLVLAFWGPCP